MNILISSAELFRDVQYRSVAYQLKELIFFFIFFCQDSHFTVIQNDKHDKGSRHYF